MKTLNDIEETKKPNIPDPPPWLKLTLQKSQNVFSVIGS